MLATCCFTGNVHAQIDLKNIDLRKIDLSKLDIALFWVKLSMYKKDGRQNLHWVKVQLIKYLMLLKLLA